MALNETAAGLRRLSCDRKLGGDIAAANGARPICEAFGFLYKKVVHLLGDPNFNGVGTSSRPQPKTEYEDALRAFLENGTDEQFRSFANDARRGNLKVDLDRPVQFTPSGGLTNK